jgi:hypothetical protein
MAVASRDTEVDKADLDAAEGRLDASLRRSIAEGSGAELKMSQMISHTKRDEAGGLLLIYRYGCGAT